MYSRQLPVNLKREKRCTHPSTGEPNQTMNYPWAHPPYLRKRVDEEYSVQLRLLLWEQLGPVTVHRRSR